MRRTNGLRLVAAVAALGLVLTACAKKEDTGGEDAGGGAADIGCSVSAPAGGATEAPKIKAIPGEQLRVGLAFDIGGRGDASFNDSAVVGLEKAKKELGLKSTKELSAAAGESEADKQNRLTRLAKANDVVLGIGFAYSEATAKIAPKFPKVQFAVVDGFIPEKPDNVTLLGFSEHQGSFLVGVIAAEKSKTGKIGFVGGVDVPLIQKFECGFKAGVKTADPDATVEVKYLTPAGDMSGFQDPAKGQVATKGLINEKKVDVVYQAAGASGKGVIAAASGAGVQAIGVDSDQYNQKPLAKYKEAIISSMIKRVDVAVFEYVTAITKGDMSTLPPVFDMKVDGVGYATSGGKVDDLKATLEEYKQKIIAGEIKVPDTRD